MSIHKPLSAAAFPQSGAPAQSPFAGALSTLAGRVVAVVLGSLFVALCAQVAVPLPWTPVPMTMQPFGVLLVGLLLGPGLGAAAMAAYLLEGAAGLPVFVPGFGGLLPLGPSAGYLLSYPLVAAVTGLLWQHLARGRASFLRAALAAAVGDALILLCGACWLGLVTHGSAGAVFHLAVLPFVAGDAIKVVLAAAIALGCLRRFHPVDTRAGA